MPDEQLEKLGDYFVHREIREKYGITFELFVALNKSGQWEKFEN